MFITLSDFGFTQTVDGLAVGHWLQGSERGADQPMGHAAPSLGPSDGRGVRVLVTTDAQGGRGVLGCQNLARPSDAWALRIDEVAFPVGAIAHRHSHFGAGWRYLVSGALRIENEHSTQVMEPGDCWFEPADTPVRAVSLHKAGITRFVRAMVIPQEMMGKSTFCLSDPADGVLPRLQVTHRHFDQPYQVEAG